VRAGRAPAFCILRGPATLPARRPAPSTIPAFGLRRIRALGIVGSIMRSAPADGRWYAYCVDFMATRASIRPPKSRQTMAHYRRIASLPAAWGALLDERSAPYYLMRWIAWGKTRSAVKARYDDAVRYNTLLKVWPTEAGLGADVSLSDLTEKIHKLIT